MCAYTKVYMPAKTIAMFVRLRGIFTIYHCRVYLGSLIGVLRYDKIILVLRLLRFITISTKTCFSEHMLILVKFLIIYIQAQIIVK